MSNTERLKIVKQITFPRFSVRALLLAMLLISLWLASSRPQNTDVGRELRSIVWFFIFAIALLSVVIRSAQVRAFWLGVLLVLLMKSPPSMLSLYQLQFGFTEIAPGFFSTQMRIFVHDTLNLGLTLGICAIAGWVGSGIYQSVHQPSATSRARKITR